jgi:hypothetical protein
MTASAHRIKQIDKLLAARPGIMTETVGEAAAYADLIAERHMLAGLAQRGPSERPGMSRLSAWIEARGGGHPHQ